MRLDKWLKNTRLLKRRTAAKREADEGHVLLNGRPVKPGREVHAGDRLVLVEEDLYGNRSEVAVEVLADAPGSVRRGDEGRYYRLIPPQAAE